MGSEQSQQANSSDAHGRSANLSRLQRGHTIAVSGRRLSSPNDDTASNHIPSESRPVSPPISVCSDSDLPYVSYTDKLGGKVFLFFCIRRLFKFLLLFFYSYHLISIPYLSHRFAKAAKQS